MLGFRGLLTAAVVLSVPALAGCEARTSSYTSSSSSSSSSDTSSSSRAIVRIRTSDDVCWSGTMGRTKKSGCGNANIRNVRGKNGEFDVTVRKQRGEGKLTVRVVVSGKVVETGVISGSSGVVSIETQSFDNH